MIKTIERPEMRRTQQPLATNLEIYTFMPPVSQWIGRREHLQETMFVKKNPPSNPILENLP